MEDVGTNLDFQYGLIIKVQCWIVGLEIVEIQGCNEFVKGIGDSV